MVARVPFGYICGNDNERARNWNRIVRRTPLQPDVRIILLRTNLVETVPDFLSILVPCQLRS